MNNYKDIPKNITGQNNSLSKSEKSLREELKQYREDHPKPWYL